MNVDLELSHDEICQALISYAEKQGIDFTDKSTEINLVAGRKNGHKATIKVKNLVLSSTNSSNVTDKEDVKDLPAEPTVESEEETSPFDEAEDKDTDSLF